MPRSWGWSVLGVLEMHQGSSYGCSKERWGKEKKMRSEKEEMVEGKQSISDL